MTGNNSFSSDAAGNFSVMKDLAFGVVTFEDPAAGFGGVLTCTFLHLGQSLAIAEWQQLLPIFSCRSARGWAEGLRIIVSDCFGDF